MAIRSGLAAQLGAVAEDTWGVYKAPTSFIEFTEESLALAIERIESPGLRVNNRVLRTDRWAAGQKRVEGTVSFEAPSKGLGLWLKHALGSSSITTPSGATNARLHTHTLGDPYGLGLTVQVGRPDSGGTVRPFSYVGCKIDQLTLSNSVDEFLVVECEIVGEDETTSESLASASYPTGVQLFNWTQGSLTIAGSSVGVVTDFNVTVANNHKSDRYFLGAALMSEPIIAGMTEVTGSMTVEFDSLTNYNRFVNGTIAAVTARWTAATAIESTFFPYVEVSLPDVRFDGTTPAVAGPDVVTIELPFKALNDGTDQPITITTQTADTTSV
jgi:hypothetical protein